MKTLFIYLLFFSTFANAENEIAVTTDNGQNKPLGSGYNSFTQTLKENCVQGFDSFNENVENRTVNILKTSSSFSEKAVMNKLGFNSGSRQRLGIIDDRETAQFTRESIPSPLSTTYNYISELNVNSYLVNSEKYPKKIRNDLNPSNDPVTWMNTCGNEFVYAHDQGARLMITYRFDFASVNEKYKFQSLFGSAGPRVITKSEFDRLSNSYHKKTKLTISAYQIGGVPFYLNQIFNNSGNHKNKISCTFDDISACLELMSNLFDYENDLKPEHFWGQTVHFKNYSTLKLYTNPWEYLGIDVQNASNNSVYNDQDEYLKILFKLFDIQFTNWLDSDRMITGNIPELIAKKRQRMEELKIVFYKNINTIKAAIETCYDLPDLCKSKTENIDSYLIPASSKDILELLGPESKSSNHPSRH